MSSSVFFSVWMATSEAIASERLAAIGRADRLHPGEHREEEVQQDEGIGIEGLVVKHALDDDDVDDGPDDHHREEAEDEGPGAHHAAHAVGGALTESELVARAHPGVLVPVRLPAGLSHGAKLTHSGI